MSTNKKFRNAFFYKNYFEKFFIQQNNRVKEKILWTIRLIEDVEIVPGIYLKYISGTNGIYEIRIQTGSDIFRIFCFFDKENLVVIGLPCNQFGGQEPGTEKEVQQFCTKNFGVSFLLTEKIEVKGEGKHQLYNWLTDKKKNGKSSSSVKWNFQKYVVDEKGEFVNYFYSTTKPMSPKITSLLKQ